MARIRRYHPSFADDLSTATAYYDGISGELGGRFRGMVRQRLRSITKHPEVYGRVYGEIRASMIERFPYVILYEIVGDIVAILAIHHAASDQGGWFGRSVR